MAKILILEDDDLVARILQRTLRTEGHEASIVCHDKEPGKVVSELERGLADGSIDGPDVVICDGLAGKYEKAGEILEENNIPYLLFSSNKRIVDRVIDETQRPAFLKPEDTNNLLDYLSNLQTQNLA